MASWEDIDEVQPELSERLSKYKPVKKSPAPSQQSSSTQEPVNRRPPQNASILPNRAPMNDSTSISQTYQNNQPTIRILSRPNPSQPAPIAEKPAIQQETTLEEQDSNTAARLHASLEQKQREYENARKRLFLDESESNA